MEGSCGPYNLSMEEPQLPSPVHEEGDTMRRTSSQTSDASVGSKKPLTVRNKSQKALSKASSTSSMKRDPSLTSFPSLSPDHAKSVKDETKSTAGVQPNRTTSQKVRDRKKTLASLTSASSSYQAQGTLFDDSPRSSMDVPGSLHLASDEHIERLIARSGPVKLVRQFAEDLAVRDSELTTLRARADARERELKKMLRDAEVASTTIEKRLQGLEETGVPKIDGASTARPDVSRKNTTRIDEMMNEAMGEDVGLSPVEVTTSTSMDPAATVRPHKSDDANVRKSTMDSGKTRSRGGSVSGWQFWNSGAASTKSSRASSIAEEDTPTGAAKQSAPSTSKRRGLDSIFQPSTQATSYFIGGTTKTVKKTPKGDAASVHSQASSRSATNWTKLFTGNMATSKEELGRPRSSSMEQSQSGARKTSAQAAESATLSRVRTHQPNLSASSLAPHNTAKIRPTERRTPTVPTFTPSPEHAKKDSDATSLGPVEMDAILPMGSKPPTMTHTYNNDQAEGLLTDRFGFIYDQRQRKRQRLAVANQNRNRLSGVESLGNFRHDSESGEDTPKAKGRMTPPKRPATPASMEGDSQPKKWSDYLIPAKMSRPTELLSHTPSAGAVVTLADAAAAVPPSRTRSNTVSVKSQKALPTTSLASEPTESSVIATAKTSADNQNLSVSTAPAPDQEPVKLLLEQLTELHDTLQTEREAKFNDFLRRVRAERFSERSSKNTPEVDLPNGELIGSLGFSKNRTKYLQFKALVLAGIPVSLRPKIWAECSGASARRVPSYYNDLVIRSSDATNMDPDIAQQIGADVGRTLTDNIFFRHGPGVDRLSEILKAYSLHNPSVGYCQGMNLITASLLLICATSEDVFWLLVAIVDQIMPSGYFDRGLRVSRADQVVLRGYVAEVLPKLDAKLEELGVELEACTFQWFLSLYSAVVSAEPLFRIWDVVLCLNSSEGQPGVEDEVKKVDGKGHDGTSSPFLFQLSLALLKLNEGALLLLEGPGQIYEYVNHSMTSHAISVDQLIAASEALRVKVKREDVLARRRQALKEIR